MAFLDSRVEYAVSTYMLIIKRGTNQLSGHLIPLEGH